MNNGDYSLKEQLKNIKENLQDAIDLSYEIEKARAERDYA